MTHAEIITAVLAAAQFFHGNQRIAAAFLKETDACAIYKVIAVKVLKQHLAELQIYFQNRFMQLRAKVLNEKFLPLPWPIP